jgi:hypothetical protein
MEELQTKYKDYIDKETQRTRDRLELEKQDHYWEEDRQLYNYL